MATRPADDLEGLSKSEILRASPRMFDWELFEKFSRVHWSVPPIIFVPTILILLIEGFVHGVGWMAAVWLPAGYLFWTLTEYWLHRVVFHFEPEKGIGAKLHWIIHGVHHDHPNDPLRLVMPPALSVPLAALFVWVFSLVIGSPGVPALRRCLPGWLPGLRHAPLPRAPSPAQDRARQAPARAAHAAPLPEPRARLRRERTVLGSRLRDRAEEDPLSVDAAAGPWESERPSSWATTGELISRA